ncbi:MAG: hypothetical protein H8E17_18970 [Deltaproteobacteria bacterium]|nr:hypothetical protein [Deltaproteobacteria bacterium]
MSEYQYYEFQAIDKPLGDKDIKALRNLSTRAQITATSFVNEYHWGDFKGDPVKLMERYYDAFLYVANWGTHWFMFKIPRRLIPIDLVKPYCLGENATLHEKGESLIFEFISETDDYEWEEGEGRLSSLISLRSDIIQGDYRALYLAWLFCAQTGEMEYDEFEPPVPAKLGDLNAPLKSFIDFMRIDADLIAVAAENSAPQGRPAGYQKALKSWIKSLSETEKNDILFRLAKDHDPHLGTELMQRFQEAVSIKDDAGTGNKPRTVADLLEKAEALTVERQRQIARQKAEEKARKKRQKAIAREKYLDGLAEKENTVWKNVADLINKRQPTDYDEAVQLLVDLRDLSKKQNNETAFKNKMRGIYEKHRRKSSFIRRLAKAGLSG